MPVFVGILDRLREEAEYNEKNSASKNSKTSCLGMYFYSENCQHSTKLIKDNGEVLLSIKLSFSTRKKYLKSSERQQTL